MESADTVKIPFGIDTRDGENRVYTYYSPCRNCTEADYDYIIEGEVVKKHKRKLSMEVRITKMLNYDFLNYRGKVLRIGSSFIYEMKYFEVIISKKQ